MDRRSVCKGNDSGCGLLDSGVIDSPIFGKIPPTGLSGGVKTLILVKFEKEKIFNASTCGDNCAKWLLKIAESEDQTINLSNVKTGSSRSKQSERNSGKYPCFELQ